MITTGWTTRLSRSIPRDVEGNLRWRLNVEKQVQKEPEFATTILEACRRDPLFFINGFVWTHDTRLVSEGRDPTIPFVLYPVQDEAAIRIVEAVGKHDLRIVKSRDMGASWLCLACLHWFFLFKKQAHIGAISRNREYVDKTGDPKSLFWKLDHINAHLPVWMLPKIERAMMSMENVENGSIWSGESTTGNIFRGGRLLAVLLDEFGAFELADGFNALYASQAVTPCRLFNSTPKGVGNAWHQVVTKMDIAELRLHWTRHPLKARGVYVAQGGQVKLLDKDFWEEFLGRTIEGEYAPPDLIEQYEFVRDGKVRSPHYDEECRRTPVASLIAQEMDMDFLGSGAPFFNREVVEAHKAEYGLDPFSVGEFLCDPYLGEPSSTAYLPSDTGQGRMALWLHLIAGNPPADGRYVAGADISSGTGAKSSSSVLTVCCRYTGEKVARFKANDLPPEDFAAYACAICRWFNNALLCWERNGPGKNFSVRLLGDLKYENVYYPQSRRHTRGARQETEPGWGSTKERKRELFAEYQIALAHAKMINRSRDGLDECLQFVQSETGSIEHSAALASMDPKNSGEDHGDEVIADAIAAMLLTDRKRRRESEEPRAEVGSVMWLRQEAARQRGKKGDAEGRNWAKRLGWDPLEGRRTRSAVYS